MFFFFCDLVVVLVHVIVIAFVCVWLSSSWRDGWLGCLSTTVWFSSAFICVLAIRTSKIYTIRDKKSNQ